MWDVQLKEVSQMAYVRDLKIAVETGADLTHI